MRTPRHEAIEALSRACVIVARNRCSTREQYGTVSELARRSGVNRTALQNVLTAGRAMSVGVLMRVAGAVGMSAGELLLEAERFVAEGDAKAKLDAEIGAEVSP